MKKKIPSKETSHETKLTILYSIVTTILWLILLFATVQIIAYYIKCIMHGYFADDSLKYGIYLIIGCFFVLFVNRDQTRNIFKVKDVKKLK